MTRLEQEGRVVDGDAARARAALAREEAARNAAEAVEAQPDWSMLFAILARAAGDEIWLESASVSAVVPASGAPRPAGEPDRTLALDGMGRRQDSVSRFVLALEETGLFSRVSLLETRRKALAHGEAISFRVECRLGGEGTP
jgi:Tfp pilus assembly protein PilN